MERTISFRLPLPGCPRAVFVTDYGLAGGRLLVEDTVVLEAPTRASLCQGIASTSLGPGRLVCVRAVDDEVSVSVGGIEAVREDQLRAPPRRSAWVHAWLALGGSVFGFISSYLYLQRARDSGDAWALKMAGHMAAWHLLLSLTLFPASAWGQRLGIRAVQAASLLFLLIHAGIAIANLGQLRLGNDLAIAIFNAASGVVFLAATLVGQRAHADMDPLRALETEPLHRRA
jgi:hypothetical protein